MTERMQKSTTNSGTMNEFTKALNTLNNSFQILTSRIEAMENIVKVGTEEVSAPYQSNTSQQGNVQYSNLSSIKESLPHKLVVLTNDIVMPKKDRCQTVQLPESKNEKMPSEIEEYVLPANKRHLDIESDCSDIDSNSITKTPDTIYANSINCDNEVINQSNTSGQTDMNSNKYRVRRHRQKKKLKMEIIKNLNIKEKPSITSSHTSEKLPASGEPLKRCHNESSLSLSPASEIDTNEEDSKIGIFDSIFQSENLSPRETPVLVNFINKIDTLVDLVVQMKADMHVQMQDLRKDINLLSVTLQQQNAKIQECDEILNMLPLTDDQDFNTFNNIINEDREKKDIVVKFFIGIGGANPAMACRSCLHKTISHKLSLLISWTGKRSGVSEKEKTRMKGTPLMECLITALQQLYKATESEINYCTMKWFQQAMDRHGGRHKRAMVKLNMKER